MLSNKTILITGGTGSFGNTFVPMTLAKFNPKKLPLALDVKIPMYDLWPDPAFCHAAHAYTQVHLEYCAV